MASSSSFSSSSSSSDSNNNSCSNSIEQVAQRLIESTHKNQMCIAVAGGGSHAVSTLASTPGASSILLEGCVTYGRQSLHSYITSNGGQTYAAQVMSDDFKYVTAETAQLMARAALRRALQYQPSQTVVETYPLCVGLGVTSTLVSTVYSSERGSLGYICATRADGTEYTCHVRLAPLSRSRAEEDVVMGKLALQAIEQLQQQAAKKMIPDDEKDRIEESFYAAETKDQVKTSAERILQGDVQAVLLLPQPDKKSYFAVLDPILPPGSLVFPGSFNPPHHGHTTLAQAAARTWDKTNNNKDVNDSATTTATPVFMELSLTNPDKPSMDPQVVSDRAHLFLELPQEDLPPQWGILLTSAPLFAEKVDILRQFMVQTHVHEDRPQLGFVIGTDTMVRIINPKYYGNSESKMLEAVREMGRSGVHFVVGGRLEQRPDEKDPRFVTGEDELTSLPDDVKRIFTLVNEDDFRVDISSTELRRKQAAEKQQS